MTRNLPRTLRSADFLVPLATDRLAFAKYFADVRAASLALAISLSTEGRLQSASDASPTKWHLAHTTRFFEAVVLMPYTPSVPFDSFYLHLFKSIPNHWGADIYGPSNVDCSFVRACRKCTDTASILMQQYCRHWRESTGTL